MSRRAASCIWAERSPVIVSGRELGRVAGSLASRPQATRLAGAIARRRRMGWAGESGLLAGRVGIRNARGANAEEEEEEEVIGCDEEFSVRQSPCGLLRSPDFSRRSPRV